MINQHPDPELTECDCCLGDPDLGGVMINQHPDPELTECDCCLGDPDLVCAACGEHSCWAGYFMCWESGTADVITKAEFESRERQAAS